MHGIIMKWGISMIYHFTEKRNLESIKKHGLLSLRKLRELSVDVPCYGGNEWSHEADMIKKVDSYVHLTFHKDHPMLFKLQQKNPKNEYVWLCINSQILCQDGVLFSNDVSNKSGVRLFNYKEFEELIDCEVLFTRTDWKNPTIQERLRSARKSEILIPDQISWEYIVRIENG